TFGCRICGESIRTVAHPVISLKSPATSDSCFVLFPGGAVVSNLGRTRFQPLRVGLKQSGEHLKLFLMRQDPTAEGLASRILFGLIVFLAVSAGYLYTFPQPTVFYAGVVLLHALGGVVAAVLLILTLVRLLGRGTTLQRVGWLLIAAGAVLGIILIKTGTARSEWKWLYLHI